MDIFARAFGDVADRDWIPVRHLLLEASGFKVADDGWMKVAGADVHGLPIAGRPWTGLMFRDVSEPALALIVAVAKAGDLVILPVGCPACVVFEHQRDHLPEDIAGQGVELVETAAQLAAVVLPSRR